MDLKVCCRCKIEKSVDEFSWHNKANNKRHYQCKACRKLIDAEYWKNHKKRVSPLKNSRKKIYRKNIQEIVNKYKDVPCADCGVKYPHYVMDFDHKFDKLFNISDSPR